MMMKPPISGRDLQAEFDNAESLEEFLASVEQDAKGELDTVFTHTTEGKGKVTLIGGIHGGTQTIQAVQKAITNQNPDHVAVELGFLQYQFVKWFKPPSSTLEVAVAIFEAERNNCETHPIDRSRLWMRGMELVYGNTPTRVTAGISLSRKILAIALPIAALAAYISGWTVIAGLLLLISISFIVYRLTKFRKDPHRNYDHALIAIITNASSQKEHSTAHNKITRSRDSKMAEQIKRLRSDGDVLAVVGYNHLQGIKNRIDSEEDNWDAENFEKILEK